MQPVTFFDYILMAFALALPTMAIVRASALKFPIRLTSGLAVSALLAVESALLLVLGLLIGNMLATGVPQYDEIVYFGLFIVVVIRMFFAAFRKRDKEPASYNIARWPTVVLLGVASGTNTLLVGLALGFRVHLSHDLWRAALPLAVVLFLLSYLGIMIGRRKKQLRERRWLVLAILFLLIFAVKGAILGE